MDQGSMCKYPTDTGLFVSINAVILVSVCPVMKSPEALPSTKPAAEQSVRAKLR